MNTTPFCSTCGRQFAADASFCSGCGAALAVIVPGYRPRLVRPRQPRMIAGVCSGVAIFYGWDLALVRILFAVFACLSWGFGLIVYLLAWVLMPEAQYALAATTQEQGNVV